jgi:FKBP-type peptidyl-prolyl cis-trans isomerase (trigger factor)
MKNLETFAQDSYGMSGEEYIQQAAQMSLADYEAQLREYLEQNLEVELILGAIAKQENITDEDGFQAYLENMAAENQYGSVEELFEVQPENEWRIAFLDDKVLGWLMERVTVENQQ